MAENKIISSVSDALEADIRIIKKINPKQGVLMIPFHDEDGLYIPMTTVIDNRVIEAFYQFIPRDVLKGAIEGVENGKV